MAEKPILMIMIFQGFYLHALLLVYGIREDKKFENTKHTHAQAQMWTQQIMGRSS